MTPEAYVMERLFHVVNKEGQDVPFKLNTAQLAIDSALERRQREGLALRSLVPKARQEGVSMYFIARAVVKCLGRRNTRAVIISHDAEATERLLVRAKYFLSTLNGPAPILKTNNRNEISFPKTNSVMFIGTAGSRKFGRGDTINYLHCSEVAYWPDPKATMTGLLQAVPKGSGEISVESTGNGQGNWYHNACMRASRGQSSFELIFLPWHTFPEYQLSLDPDIEREILANLRSDLREPEAVRQYGLSAGQLAWRRMVIEDELEGSLRDWNQEYPSGLDDCFQSATGSMFQDVNYLPTPRWKRVDQHLCVLEDHPMQGRTYVLGADVAAGVGADSSAAEIFDAESGEQVAEWISDSTEPDVFGHKCVDLARWFNEAYMCVENNNHGILTAATIRDSGYPQSKVYRTPAPKRRRPTDPVRRLSNLGLRTTVQSKPYIIGLLRKSLRQEWTVHSPVLKSELSSFIEHPNGTLGAAENCHDDTVIAAALARSVRDRALTLAADPPEATPTQESLESDPMTFEAILANVKRSRPLQPFIHAETPLL